MSEEYFEISLEQILLRGNHGVFEQEREVGNEFEVTVNLRYPIRENQKEDCLDNTLSYADLYTIIKQEFDKPSALLETVCLRIERKVKEKWPDIEGGEIKIVKISPPIPGIRGRASVKKFF